MMRLRTSRWSGRTPSRTRWTGIRLTVFGTMLMLATGMTWASWTPDIHLPPIRIVSHIPEGAVNTWSSCLHDAAAMSGVDPALLHAIVTVESGEHPYAFGWNDRSGKRHRYKAVSYTDAVATLDRLEQQHLRFDAGLAQVNSRNFRVLQARTGIPAIRVLDPCTNLRWAATILKEQIAVHGPTWRAVAGYNGATIYVAKVQRAYCREVPAGGGCRPDRPLTELLCDPLPVSETSRYYHAFRRWS